MRAFAREFSFGDSTYSVVLVCMNAKPVRNDAARGCVEARTGTFPGDT